MMKAANEVTDDEISEIHVLVVKNLKWLEDNLDDIELWLNKEIPNSTPTDDTTLGSSSVIASFALTFLGFTIKILL